MDAPSNSASSSCSSAAAPLADGQDDRAVLWPAQDSPASPATKEPHLPDPSSSSTSPSPDEIMRPSSGSQAAFSSAQLPAAILSTPELQADFSLVTPNPSPFPQAAHPSEDGDKEEEEDGEEEDGGNEAQLYFSAEGSAYLLSGGHVLLPKGSPSTTVPLVSILHVQRGGGPNQGFMSTDQMSQNTSAPSEWTPHGAFYSYRLAGAPTRTTSAKNAPTKPKDAPTAHVEDVENPKGEASLGKEEEEELPQPPIWLCLICHLSFRRGCSLATHARAAHGVQLSTNQCQALSRGASAVFQGTTVGFLEPNNPTTKADLNARMCSRWVNVTEEKKKEEEEEEKESLEGECEPPDAKDSRVGGEHWAKLGGTEDKPENEEKEEEEEEEEEAAEKKKEEGMLLSDQSSHGQSPPVGVNPLFSETPQKKASINDRKVDIGLAKEDVSMELANKVAELAKEVINVGLAREVTHDDAGGVNNPEPATKVNSDSLANHTDANSTGLAHDVSTTELAHGIANVGVATDIGSLGFDVNNAVSNNHHNGGPPLSFGEDFTTMAYSGLTLSGHMSLLHSRNSCKTLKCPKCNWHYKYQQTLDVHMKEKHPENNSHCAYCSTGGPHPRLARGESYNCGYKPYRCEACNYSTTTKGNLSIHMQSDKHLANLQGYQATGGGGTTSAPPPAAPTPTSPEEKESKGKSSWQCKVCSYETNISRNLRIHMTSEKHMQNVLLLHQGLPLALPGLLGQPPPPPGGKPQPELFQFYGAQTLSHTHHPHPHHTHSGGTSALRGDKPMEQAQLLLNGGFPHLNTTGRKMPTLGSAPVSLSPEPAPPSPLPPHSGSDLVAPQSLFSCLVCQVFSTDSLEALLRHASAPRSLPEAEWKEVSGDLHRCRLCAYGTQLKANFQLHLKTDKHALKYQLAAHLREGSGATAHLGAELPLGPPLHLHCNLCEYETNSKEKMRLHVAGAAGHQEALQGYKFLLEMEATSALPAGPEPAQFRCLLCNIDTPNRLVMIQHLRSPQHRDTHGQWRLQLLQNGEGTPGLERYICFAPANPGSGKEPLPDTLAPEKETLNKAQAPGSDEAETKAGGVGDTTVFCCPYCNYTDQAAEAVRAHTISQHAVQPKFRCPLCQEQLVGRTNLHFHLSHIHNVVPECVEKLLLVATTVEMTFATKVVPGLSLPPDPPKLGGTPNSEQGGGNESESPLVAPVTGEKLPPAPMLGSNFSMCAAEASTPMLGPETPPPPAAASPTPPADPLDKPPPEPSTPPPAAPLESEDEDHPRPNAPPEELPSLPSQAPAEALEASPLAFPSQDPRHPLSYRKATNFALDKFLDPARPYKCTVCKESFTQKNILLVHYNSVSHLHKMKKASADPSAPSRGEPGTPGALQPSSDKPYKCTTCRVSYNQSSTLEIHMRSVLHQTRSRVAKMEAAGKAEVPSTDLEPPSEPLLEPEAPKLLEASCVQVPALPFLAPSTADLQRFPTPLFTPPLLPPFPLVPESLLKLQQQQQQLLLPFYLHDLKVTPKLALAAPALTLPATPPVLLPPPVAKEEQAPAASSTKPEPTEDPEAEEAEGSQPGNEASRTAAKALLENFGFELVIQYNEGKQPATAAPTAPPRPPAGKLQCGTCGKQFSNMLILKTHEEHVHRRFLPFEALNRYAVQFRKSYDSMYQPPPPALPVETTPTPTAATETATVTVTPASLPLEIPSLCPPFLMQPMPVVVPPPEGEAPRVSPERLKSLWFRGEDEEGGATSAVLDPSRGSFPTTRRFSRTKFTEFQSQALQSFFESSAYPKDGEVERLSVLLGLPNRVIVVWFQNARQKARKYGGNEASMGSGSATTTQPSCKKCRTSFRCIFELVRHLKKCYNDQPEEGEGDCAEEENEAPEEEEEEEEVEEEQQQQQQQQEPLVTDGEVKTDGTGDKPPEEEPTAPAAPSESSIPHPCDQCTATFSSTDLLSVHRVSHMPAAGPPPATTGPPPPPLDLAPLVFSERVAHPDSSRAQKRKHDDGSLSPTGSECASVTGGDGEPPRDKRLRTTILPEQLEILYRWYMQDSNPTRKMLDCISEEVGLKKRVVQVWFQNTRARERKGQFRCSTTTVNQTSKPSPVLPTTFPKFNAPSRDPPLHYGAAFTPSLPVVNVQPPPAKPELPADPQTQEEAVEEEASKENEERSLSGGELSDSSSSSSLADMEFSSSRRSRATGDGGLGGGMHDALGQRRYRTQMSSLQLKIMKACYEAYRTPTMQECEVLGEEIGLPKRVIQVWFQNARAKEKKAKAATGGGDEGPLGAQAQSECPYCEVKYDFYVSCRGHLFSRGHLARLKEAIKVQLKSESKCYELVPDKGTPSPTRLGTSMPPTTVPTSLGSMAPFVPGPSSSSGALSSPLVSTQPGPPLPQHLTPEPDQLGSSAEPAAPVPEASPSDSQADPASSAAQEPSLSSSTATLKNLKTLKAAVPALLGGQFLPFPLPAAATAAAAAAAPSLFGAQLPGAYFQQLYGMKKGLFPMNPVIPQTLMGLLPSSLLPTPMPEPPVEVSEAPGISTVDVTHQYICRQCKAAFESEGAAAAHQAAFCYFGRQPPAAPPPLRVPVCTYHCLACEVLVSGREALGAHLRSNAHRRKAGSNAATASVFAKEESKLPHSDSNPKSNATSTTLLAL